MSNRSSVESGILDGLSRREFVATSATAVAAATLVGQGGLTQAAEEKTSSEQLVTKLYESLNDKQRARVCFDWNHNDDRGLLRTHVSNNWSITDRRELNVGGSFFNKNQ